MDKKAKTILIVAGVAIVGVVLLFVVKRPTGTTVASPTTGTPDTSQQLTDYQSLLALNNTQANQWQQVQDQVSTMQAFNQDQQAILTDANKKLANVSVATGKHLFEGPAANG